MKTLWLQLKAPFAAFRWMQAGVYRASSPVIPPSAAWGLVLNIAGIDIRDTSNPDAANHVRGDLPVLELAIGTLHDAEVNSVYQQLHSYPVGSSGKERIPLAKGTKHWIAPVRREFLVGFDCVIGVRGNDEVVERIPLGLRGELDSPRYGLPFAGDNNFLFDSIKIVEYAPEANWFAPVDEDQEPSGMTCRLTVSIDRTDASKTETHLFSKTDKLALAPENTWIRTPRTP